MRNIHLPRVSSPSRRPALITMPIAVSIALLETYALLLVLRSTLEHRSGRVCANVSPSQRVSNTPVLVFAVRPRCRFVTAHRGWHWVCRDVRESASPAAIAMLGHRPSRLSPALLGLSRCLPGRRYANDRVRVSGDVDTHQDCAASWML